MEIIQSWRADVGIGPYNETLGASHSTGPRKQTAPALRKNIPLNGTHPNTNVGADAHIGPKPYGTDLIR